MKATRSRRSTRLHAVALGAALALLSGVVFAEEPLEKRRAEIERMNPDELAVLHRRWDRFRALPSAERNHLRQLHRDLEADPRRVELHEVLVRYQEWLKQLSPGERAELMSLAPEQRIRRIKRLQTQQRRRNQRAQQFRSDMEMWASNQPSPRDIDAIWSWLEEFTDANGERILSTVPDERRAYLEGLDRRHRQINLMGIALRRSRHRGSRQAQLITADDLRNLESRLSVEAQAKLAQITSPGRRNNRLRQWVHSAVFTHMREQDTSHGRFQISAKELEHFFEYDLTSDERASLLDMSRKEMERELRWLYMQGPSAKRASARRQNNPPRDWGGPPFRHGDRPRGPHGRGRPPRRGPPDDFGPPPPRGNGRGPR